LNPNPTPLASGGTRAWLVALQLPSSTRQEVEEHLAELAELAASAGLTVVGRSVQSRRAPEAATFIGRGRAEAIAEEATAAEANVVVFDDDLTPGQVKELEKVLGRATVDRSGLILELFRQRARTREARTQVELARLRYLLPRLARMWTHLSRQAGGVGQRGGAGEKQIEVDRRLVRQRIARLERELKTIVRTRAVQRDGRREPVVALAGYTNVGKSTLFNRLTGAGVTAQDRLFATLDPRLRRGGIGEGRWAVFADTVGFIRKLPHHLVASFESTLAEAAHADVVLHVVDPSHPQWEAQREVAEEVLFDLGVDPDRIVTVHNKADRVEPSARRGGGLWVSALSGEGIDELRATLRRRLPAPQWQRAAHEVAP
jgi:GTPase